MNNVDLKEYLPICYKDVVEAEAEQDALSNEIDRYNTTCEQAMNDQFIQNCSLKAIGYYENTFHIVAQPSIESLEFRKARVLTRMQNLRPPYTYWYLRKMFDNFFGPGNYKLEIDEDLYKITLESSADSSGWYHEIQVTMVAVKPANMIFINKPQVTENLLINETVKSNISVRNYRLDGTWRLGLRPFVTIGEERTEKMPGVNSIRQYLITKNLENIEDLVSSALINNTASVTNLNTSIEGSNLIIEYGVNHSTASSITNIKLRDGDDITLVDSNVFIPVDDYVIIKHIINLKEGVNGQ